MPPAPLPGSLRRVLVGSSLGTLFEWYDFFLYALMTPIFVKHFFSGLDETWGFFAALLTFSVGFLVRPFGGLFFGWLGDLRGRKISFLITIIIMGLATFAVGLIPSYATIGALAPALLILMRMLQGLALGGEYGGAVIFVAEHAPSERRGFFTSFIQATALVAFILSLMAIVGTTILLGNEAFQAWGWRIPFLISIVLLGISIWIRLKMEESPVFQEMQREGRLSRKPIKELFTTKENTKIWVLALFGLVAGQAIVAYTSQFYAVIFMSQTALIDQKTGYTAMAIALVFATPFLIFCGWLSDKIGWKPLFITGCLLAAASYLPAFKTILEIGRPHIQTAGSANPVRVMADPATCGTQFQLVGSIKAKSPCEEARVLLTRRAIQFEALDMASGATTTVEVGKQRITAETTDKSGDFGKRLAAALENAGYTQKPNAEIDFIKLTSVLTLLVMLVGLTYGPTAAALVSLFPPQIRYTGVSFAYHLGNGWFGGFMPPTAFALAAAFGNPIAGAGYAVVVALMSASIAFLLPSFPKRD